MAARQENLHTPHQEIFNRRPKDSIAKRIQEYLPPQEILEMRPDVTALALREQYRKSRPGDEYALVHYHDKLIFVPSWHPLNDTPKLTHASQYGTGSFEGLSAEPVSRSDGNGKSEITGANLILLEARMNRLFNRSLPAMKVDSPVSKETYAQGITDLIAVLGNDIFVGKNGQVGRAYVRPSVSPGMGKLGISLSGQEVDTSAEAWHWPTYFSKDATERAYHGSGLILAAGPHQRLEEITGKHASNYGHASPIVLEAKQLGADEGLFFSPYSYGPQGEKQLEFLSAYKENQNALRDAMHRLTLADGPGEEVLAISSNGELWVPPIDVNRLGGTTAAYMTEYLAPTLQIPTAERAFTIGQIKEGEVAGLVFAGNASRIAAIGEIRMHDSKGKEIDRVQMQIPEVTRKLIDRYDKEVRGMVKPSHSSLLTPVDMKNGHIAREKLDEQYKAWMR